MNGARVLLATFSAAGHVAPFLPLARALVERGYEVLWYTGSKYRTRVEATGAGFTGPERARDLDDARLDEEFPERTRHSGLAQFRFDLKHVFIDSAPGQLADLDAILRRFPADVVLHDPGMLGALLHRERGGPPNIVLGVVPMVMSSTDTAPFGLGLPPSAGFFGRLRNRALNTFVQRIAFRDVQAHWNEMRARLKLGPTGWWMDEAARATCYLQPSIPSFEYPRSDLPENVRFIGMMPAEQPLLVSPPPFMHELDGSRPVVHVTQGTVANTSADLIAPTLDALADEDVLVVVSTGNRPPEALGLGAPPKNVRVATFLSYPELLPKTSVMVTNGGYGGVQTALSYGVPLVVAGISEDKPEVAARVAWSGAGLNLKTGKPRPDAIRTAVRTILADPRYRERARALAREYRSHDPIARTIEVVESLRRNTASRRASAVA
jgi:UDP:flavonoid glycosyltransferase YjiC (YdhE family)